MAERHVPEYDPNEYQEPTSNDTVRLQKVLANAGVASRRVCEQLILEGRVRVNGVKVTELGTKINPETDKVSVNGNPVQLDASRVYLALNKPDGVVSSMNDEHGRPDLHQYSVRYDRVFNVGRLDIETTGLLLLTNDGDLAHKLAHPSFGVEKLYWARVKGEISQQSLNKLLNGIELEDGLAKADRIRLLDAAKDESLVEIVLHSGKNRIVRRMFEAVGHDVVGLVRKQFGPIQLGPLRPGQVRELSKLEVAALLKIGEGKNARVPRPFDGKPPQRPQRKATGFKGKGKR
ncbi:MAG: pseudouridine synthase [Micrococcales bacterium]